VNIVEKLEQKWRSVAALFYVQRRWIAQLSVKTQQLRAATAPSLPYNSELVARLVADVESVTESLESNAEEILDLLGG